MSAGRIVLVPHTHWDREWYRTHEEFRYRLVRLLDRLLEILEGDPAYRHFTLDGQTIVVDDYLEVRPAAAERISKLVRDGRLCVGPWTVLPDEWLVSGEALIRNLRFGLRRAAELGGSMEVGYVPDQFGHVGQLPQLLAGFGLHSAVLWRGVGVDVDRTLFHWEAPDGTRLLTVYLMQGYGNASTLPLEPEALAGRLRAAADALAAHSPVPTLLLMNGSDHVEPQPGLPAALEAAAPLLGMEVGIGTLAGYVETVRAQAPRELPLHRGELRSGLRSPLLPGCASSRLPQKRADFENDRLLVRYVEPLAAWLGALGGDPDVGILEHAWRIALENHPHDSICGCSVDAVHDEMDVRFARVGQIARTHLARVGAELAARVAAPVGRGPLVVAWNPHGSGRVHAAGAIELDVPAEGRRAPALHLLAPDGARVPLRCEILEPGIRLADYRLPATVAALLVRGFPEEFTGLFARDARLRRTRAGLEAEILLGGTAPPPGIFAGARAELAAALEARGDESVRYRVRRVPRVGIECVDEAPGCGLRVYRVAKGRAAAADRPEAGRRDDGGAFLANRAWRVEVGPDGRVSWEHRESGCRVEDALRIRSEGDRGDEYDFDPVDGDRGVVRPEQVRVRLARRSEVEAGLVIESRYRVPAGLAPGRRSRAGRCVPLRVRTELRLWAGLDRVDCDVRVSNTARDQRLRIELRAPFRAERFEVESAFEAAERPIEPAPDAFGSEQPAQLPTGACPQRHFATLAAGELAFSVANRGAAEVEALRDGAGDLLAVTLLRAVGWLSRDDLRMRRGHAGPALETPGAQVPGEHRIELSWRLHPSDAAARTAEAHRFAAPALLFSGFSGASAGPGDGDRLLEVDDPGVVVSALEPLAGGGSGVRLYDSAGRRRTLELRWNGPGKLEAVDLAGRPDPAVRLERLADGRVRVELGAQRILALRAS